MSPWPFMRWGMDILDPFTPALGQLICLIILLEYFTKWIEAGVLANITTANVIKFFKKNILAIFSAPSHSHK